MSDIKVRVGQENAIKVIASDAGTPGETGAQGTTGGNWVTPTATGFTTNSAGGSLVNENGSTFIYLAFKQN